ncbi:MAG: class I SAM-dependent methyltransferase [Crocosphaera sp.]|jgi:ubiquinone/menaquinone biosynthesis C-methylase UbiE
MIDEKNYQTYSQPEIVRYYQQLKQLQPAEETIIKLLRDKLSKITMLDIGVGGGRTTKHFYPLVKKYIGIDYSSKMIAACQQRFVDKKSINFTVCDVRNLSQFEDNYFDFILFSFNGIDYISHPERLQVFQEIHRVGKPGGYFFFSTHNLQAIEKEFHWKTHIKFNPVATYINLVMFAFIRFFNKTLTYEQIKNKNYAIIRDESHNFRLQTYYIRPLEQIKQLESKFSNIKVYSWKTGLEINPKNDIIPPDDMWLYYLCLIN